MGSWQDDHAEKDVKESPRSSGQDAPVSRSPLQEELLGRLPQWHGKGKVPFRSEATHGDVSPGRITTLELRGCYITGPHAEWLAGGVLAQCRALVHLDLSEQSDRRCWGNWIKAAGLESLAGVLGHYASLVHLDLSENRIGDAGAESLAGVLAKCRQLTHLDLRSFLHNGIEAVAAGRLQASWHGQASGLRIYN